MKYKIINTIKQNEKEYETFALAMDALLKLKSEDREHVGISTTDDMTFTVYHQENEVVENN